MNGGAIRVCCVQAQSVPSAPVQNLARAGEFAQAAKREGATLVVFPEQFPTGWDPHATYFTDDGSGPICRGWAAIARKTGIYLLGSYRKETAGMPQNVAAVFAPDGACIAEYAKMHLFSPGGEDDSFQPGDALATVTIGGVRFGIAICYDLRFPELFSAYRQAGCDAVVVPAAWPCVRLKHWHLFLHARALENQMYVAGVNPADDGQSFEYCGGTTFVTPQGEVAAEAEGPGGTLVFADIDPALVRSVRSTFPVASDRRYDLYSSL